MSIYDVVSVTGATLSKVVEPGCSLDRVRARLELCARYLLFELFLLVFEGFLDFVHETALLEEASRRTHTVELEGGRQFDFFVLHHDIVKQINYNYSNRE